MKQDDPQFKLRIPPELKRQLEEAAKSNTRTLGAEIVARLQASFGRAQSGGANLVMGAIQGGGGTYESLSLAQLAGHLHDMQGKRNTLAMVDVALRDDEHEERRKELRKEIDAIDLQIARLVRIIRDSVEPDASQAP